MAIEVRPVQSKEELRTCFRLWESVFSSEVHPNYFQDRSDPDMTWIVKKEGNIISSSQIFPYQTYFHGSLFQVGGISHVATIPAMRNQGYAQDLLREQQFWLKNHQYDFSLLFTAFYDFYHPLGWELVPETWYMCRNGDLKLTFMDSNLEYRFSKPSEFLEIQDLYQICPHSHSHARRRNFSYWKKQMQWRKETEHHYFVAYSPESSKIRAYIRYEEKDNELKLLEACYAPSYESTICSLFSTFLRDKNQNLKVSARMPMNHPLVSLFERNNIEHSVFGSMMWQAFDWVSLFKKSVSTFEKRGNLKNQILLFVVEGTLIFFVYDENGKLTIKSHIVPVRYDVRFTFSQQEMLALWLQGTLPSSNSYSSLLRLLFPFPSGVFWTSDFF